MSAPPAAAAARGSETDGLAAEVAAVEAARSRMAGSLEHLQNEARAQVGVTVERVLWKVAGVGAAVAAGLVTRQLVNAAWRAARKGDPPRRPGSPTLGWGEALAWSLATGVGAAIARLVAERGAAVGWRRATGHLPPGLED